MNRCLLIVLAASLFSMAMGCMCGAPVKPLEQQATKSEEQEVTPTGSEAYHDMIQYRAKDAKQAILDPELVSAKAAIIAPGTKVIGVFVGGQARAYPLFILNNHQIVNDRVGGIPLSASW
jgi:hypothetical protein